MGSAGNNQVLLVTKVARGYRVFCTIMGVVSGITILVMSLSTTLDTTSRYIFNHRVFTPPGPTSPGDHEPFGLGCLLGFHFFSGLAKHPGSPGIHKDLGVPLGIGADAHLVDQVAHPAGLPHDGPPAGHRYLVLGGTPARAACL